MKNHLHDDIRLYRIARATVSARSGQLTSEVIVAFNSQVTGGLTALLAHCSSKR